MILKGIVYNFIIQKFLKASKFVCTQLSIAIVFTQLDSFMFY